MINPSLTFANFGPNDSNLPSVYEIGYTQDHPDVAHEMADAFEHELTLLPDVNNLGGLISKVGPAKELRENIGRVQDVLGTDADALTIARGWAERSGLLIPVERLYLLNEGPANEGIDLAIISGGVRNWMLRRAMRLVALGAYRPIGAVLLAAGQRPMKTSEGPDVEEGMTEADYMRDVIAQEIGAIGTAVEVLSVATEDADNVMRAAANKAHEMVGLSYGTYISVVSNAGAWVQNAGQFLRAAMSSQRAFNNWGDQLEVVSDAFPLGETGEEPTSTHQNPFSAAGQIARNLQELARFDSLANGVN
jgi:hypothetical protein